jgi:hypothetical protein
MQFAMNCSRSPLPLKDLLAAFEKQASSIHRGAASVTALLREKSPAKTTSVRKRIGILLLYVLGRAPQVAFPRAWIR